MCEATTGKLTPGAFYIHSDWAAGLSPVLRVYEGCARALVGDVPNTNIIKLSREKFRVSYLSYPDFGRDPHPSLDHSVVVKLQALDVRYRSFDDSPNPPILHRKDTLVDQSDLCYEKYRRLTEQEDRWDLLDDSSEIGTRDGWNRRLKERGFRLSGHRLVRDRRM
jgi:DNA phosphorothioation-associated putative methyltransferase